MWLASEIDDDWTDAKQFETREEALEQGPAALGLYPGEIYYIGRYVPPEVPTLQGHDLVFQLQTYACNAVGDYLADDWLEYLDRAKLDELEKLVNNNITHWLTRHRLLPTWFTVDKAETHIVFNSLWEIQ